MNLTQVAAPLVVALSVFMTGCSKEASTEKPAKDTAAVSKPAQPMEAVAAQGKGFAVGALMSVNTVYVMFDPQCPHCGHLWEASVPLQKKVATVAP